MEKQIGSNYASSEGEQCSQGSAAEYKRWSAHRKKDAVIRMICGEPLDELSRELCIEICRLEEWHERAMQGMEDALKLREGDPHLAELEAAMRRIGEISLENELLRERIKKQNTLNKKRTKR